MSLDPERRAALLAGKLAALVREHGPGRDWLASAEPASIGGDAALLDASHGIGWVLVDDDPARALGRALAWAGRAGVAQLHVFADVGAGDLARRAGLFELGDGAPTVWSVEGRAVEQARPTSLPPAAEPTPAALELGALVVDAGAELVVEHGVVVGEVLGLEVARVVEDDVGTRLEVGVGRHDREAFAMLHGDLPVPDALTKVVEAVRAERRPGRPAHPLNRLAPERWLRRWLVEDPARAGFGHLEPVAGPAPRRSVQDTEPAFAVGVAVDGSPALVACTVGIDLEALPAAVDLWASSVPEATVHLVLPARDVHPAIGRMADQAVAPVELHPLDVDWRV